MSDAVFRHGIAFDKTWVTRIAVELKDDACQAVLAEGRAAALPEEGNYNLSRELEGTRILSDEMTIAMSNHLSRLSGGHPKRVGILATPGAQFRQLSSWPRWFH